MSFAWDVTQQIKIVSQTPGWIAQLAVGQLRADDFGRDAGRRRTGSPSALSPEISTAPTAPLDTIFEVRRSRSTTGTAG